MEEFDVTSNMLMMSLISVLLWVAKKYTTKLDDHVKKCDKRAIRNARTMQWIGDGMHSIAVRTGAHLPRKPEFDDNEEED